MPTPPPPVVNFTPVPTEPLAADGTQHTAYSSDANPGQNIVITPEQIAAFGIPEKSVTENSVLIDLILKTESMKDEERKYWFQLLPIMTEEQITKLQGILQNERDQLAALDAKYDTEIQKLNDKHLLEWKEHEAREKRKQREEAEKAHAEKEAATKEDILNQLNDA